MVVDALSSNTLEVEAEGSLQVPGQPGLQFDLHANKGYRVRPWLKNNKPYLQNDLLLKTKPKTCRAREMASKKGARHPSAGKTETSSSLHLAIKPS